MTEQIAVDTTHHILRGSELHRAVENVFKNNSFGKRLLSERKVKVLFQLKQTFICEEKWPDPFYNDIKRH